MHRLYSVLFAALSFFAACEESQNTNGPGSGPTSSSSATYKTSADIGASGGTINDPGGNWTFTIPANALRQTKTITITTNAKPIGDIPENYSATTATLRFEPEGLTFLTPAMLKIKYAQGDMREDGIEEKMQKQYYVNDDSTVTAMASTLDTARNEVSAQVPHFSFSATLTSSIQKVNTGAITRRSSVRRIANQVIAYFNGLANDAVRSAEFNANWTLLLTFCQKLVARLGSDLVTAAFPNADWNLNGVINSLDPIVPVSGAAVTLVSSGSLFVSANTGATNTTQFVWRSSLTGTYTIRLNGTSCSDGALLGSGTVTATADNTFASIDASALITGDNEFYICVSAGGYTTFMVVVIVRDEISPASSSSPASGTYTSEQNVSITCSDTGGASCAQIAYTIDGTDPAFNAAGGVTNGTLVTGMWLTPIDRTTTLKVRSRDDAGNISAVETNVYILPPEVAFSPEIGPAGSLITLTSSAFDLANLDSARIGNVDAVIISRQAGVAKILVMPGTNTNAITVTAGAATRTTNLLFTLAAPAPPTTQQGSKLVGSDSIGESLQGISVAISADGNTAIVGGPGDNFGIGAAWIFVRNGTTWTQQGAKLLGNDGSGASQLGRGVAISADGNTVVVGGYGDNGGQGAAWIFVRTGSTWSQFGAKLVGTQSIGSSQQGYSVALSADGKTAAIGGPGDDSSRGATWVFAQTSTGWSQSGTKLIGTTTSTSTTAGGRQGQTVAISADGNTIILGAPQVFNYAGQAWVFARTGGTWLQQGPSFRGADREAITVATGVAISADGNTGILGAPAMQAAYPVVRIAGNWQPQDLLQDATAGGSQGSSVALSADGNTAVWGGYDFDGRSGAAWVGTRSGTTWVQDGAKLLGSGRLGESAMGYSAALAADGRTAIFGGQLDNGQIGAAWIFSGAAVLSASNPSPPTAPSTSVVSTLAGTTIAGFVDAVGAGARFNYAKGVAADAAGNLYVADQSNHAIRKISISGVVSTIAGTNSPGLADGNGGNARFNYPAGIAIDLSGNLYVADTLNHAIRKISINGDVTTLAGANSAGFTDGTAGAARFNYPEGVAADIYGNIYVGDTGNNAIRKISSNGTVITLAGASTSGFVDANGPAARFYSPRGVAVDASGNIYVADSFNNAIRKVSSTGDVTTLVGYRNSGFVDSMGTNARFSGPYGVSIDSSGNVYVADSLNNAVRKISAVGLVTTLAGSTTSGFADGIGPAVQFYNPTGVTVDASGIVYVTDFRNSAIRKIQ